MLKHNIGLISSWAFSKMQQETDKIRDRFLNIKEPRHDYFGNPHLSQMAKDAEIKRFTVKVSYREKSEIWAF